MNTNDFLKLRSVESAADIPEKAVYYSIEFSGAHSWYVFYDADTNVLDHAKVRYTNAVSGLRRIVRSDDHDKIYYAYNRIRLNDRFDLIEAGPDTINALEAMAASVKPENWN